MDSGVLKYCAANPLSYNLESNIPIGSETKFSNAVVIPAFFESDHISNTLSSLFVAVLHNRKIFPGKTRIIVVVNNPSVADCDPLKYRDNQKLLQMLRNNAFDFERAGLFLSWIDASSPGCEVCKNGGVGLARKIGMDAVLPSMDWEDDPLLFSLDADTLVENNYISAVKEFFVKNPDIVGGSVDFLHQKGATLEEEKAIRLYECYLRHYVDGLRNAKTPYAYHSIGSTIVCRASAYIKAGGMRPKPAGEDFYFLQALCKVGQSKNPIGSITSTKVYPSPRISDRVPFGTGKKMEEYRERVKASRHNKKNNTHAGAIFYNPTIFKLLKRVIAGVEDGTLEKSFEVWYADLPEEGKSFFDSYGFRETWNKILKNTPGKSEKIKWAFHTWFDAFRILKFIHFCEKPPFNLKKCSPGLSQMSDFRNIQMSPPHFLW